MKFEKLFAPAFRLQAGVLHSYMPPLRSNALHFGVYDADVNKNCNYSLSFTTRIKICKKVRDTSEENKTGFQTFATVFMSRRRRIGASYAHCL